MVYVAKTKALISCAVTAQLICGFVFAYAKSRFSHDAAQIIIGKSRSYYFAFPPACGDGGFSSSC